MSEEKIDYQKLKFKCGLEIHQQLDTSKLFCNCPSLLRQDEPDFFVKRNLHAVAGEAGDVDVAAMYQASLDKEFVYQGYDTTCLVELDEEPPHEINKEALKIALQISVLLNAKIIPFSQIMRKTVIDGSNTSGFQRTVMIARDGFVETDMGRVRIEGIFLEEDAARPISREKTKVVYRLDRLGIPLVEIATAPDIKTPEQAKEVALEIGNILRSCKVKRGIGTIRQDVNMSLKGGNRVEIKGMQDMKIFIKVIEDEIKRQSEILKKKKIVKSEVRNVLPNGQTEFLRPMPGAARMYPETDVPLLRVSREIINNAKKSLPKLKSDVEIELKEKGLSLEMIKLLFKQDKLEEFRELLEVLDNPPLVAKVLLIFPKEIARHKNKSFNKVDKFLNKDVLLFVLEAIAEKKITQSQIKSVLERIVDGEDLEEAIKFEKESEHLVEEKILKIIKEKPGLSEKAYMGLIMKEFKGKIDGKDVIEIIRKYLK
ncbi:MAG: Glu-tRNA(Gln) amidotransferase subunit GatE [Nanoarchaeota archaeon]|nr:Glu-tRNA(Gln) amidotransferase subunit GatE [Nanoarchaeota archaeon]